MAPRRRQKVGTLAGRTEAELQWIAAEVRQALNLPANSGMEAAGKRVIAEPGAAALDQRLDFLEQTPSRCRRESSSPARHAPRRIQTPSWIHLNFRKP
jgi:hypothetical protein